ncbi:RAB6A-GEF complex partner protein 1 [Marchantia polymorpha subsp. ruderalis]|uniref:RIC1 C-terminal alpha solenoid region domain-containing protein n=2 Tax=Marchantia polymorpha TaxID=3197 RepID=A0AAF6BFE6_MARPO|nr:short rhizoids 1 [Marchantia polymorpha]PTQ42903.1 hypothetical protein MARPO_0027s0035 [Marchantia polymorpha]BBN10730.1 hypothetical protein Mp_5g05920 [Marchantia polymorpha subsp. ruderalis]|eukprot:PTQ42903.1 hypothetical protein MARPO_0027s0035 [Marchantia polymorpha]
MYVAYGWPKLLPIAGSQERLIHVSVSGSLLLLVSSSDVQVWSATQHRTKLGQLVRDPTSVQYEGINLQAKWSSDSRTVVVMTSGCVLHFYDIYLLEKQLKLSGEEIGLHLVEVHLRSTVNLVSTVNSETISVCCLTADDRSIIVGLSDGRLQLVSWSGELLSTAELLQGPASANGSVYIPETNGSPTVAVPAPLALHPSFSSSNSQAIGESGFGQLELSSSLHLLVAVLTDGYVLLCSINEKGLRQVSDIIPEKWVGITDAVCASVAHLQQLLAVGCMRGTVELFNLADNALPLRTISLFDWGYSVEDTGPVNCISWTPDNFAFSVGWQHRGLAVWSVSGCRLMCTIRQGSLSNVFSPSFSMFHGTELSRSEPMVGGVAASAWGEHGYQLFAVEQRNVARLIEFPFAKSCISQNVVGVAHVWQLLQGEDRVLLVQSDEEDQLKIQHLVLPLSYIGVNWPVLHVAANEDGTYLAIAGRRGVILYDMQLKKWRVFGDVTQERQVQCVGLLWVGKIVVVCNYRESSKSYELSLYPRYHLDETSLLFRRQLPDKPIAMDVWQDFILVTCPPFDINIFHVHVHGNLSPLKPTTVQLFPVRELSIMNARKPPLAMHFLPNVPGEWDPPPSCDGSCGDGWRDVAGEAILRQPTRCMLLRTDGELSLLDLDRGSERRLISGVERFWLTCGRPKEEAALIKEVPWWAYGHRGMQVWYPSSPADSSHDVQDAWELDPELDFDREVYPLGLCPGSGVIVGIAQRLSLSACAAMPCFEPTPQAQPILPCLLRHLLQRDKAEEALQLARLSCGRPHFSHSLEWLLFTVFDAAVSSQYVNRKRGKVSATASRLLHQVCILVRHFPEYLDVVVSVARKTDGRHWSELFEAAGKSTELFEECFQKGSYRTAACYILVIQKLEGPTISQQSAVRLLKATLEVSLYELAGELCRFLLRAGREYEADKEAERNIFSAFFLGLSSPTSPAMGDDMHHATVKHILEKHAAHLMELKELQELVTFARGTQFDITDFLKSEKGKSARLEDFSSALRIIGQKLDMDVAESRQDAEFLLGHMKAVGFKEWVVVLATLLRLPEILLELFRGDARLWEAYSKTLQSQENFLEYEDFLSTLEQDLAITRETSESE